MRKAGVEGTKEGASALHRRENLGFYFLDFHDGVEGSAETRVTFASTYFVVRCYAYRTFIRDAREVDARARANFIAILPILLPRRKHETGYAFSSADRLMSLSDLTRHLVTSSKAKRERGNEEKGEERGENDPPTGKNGVTFVQVIIAFNDFLTTVFGSRQKKEKKKKNIHSAGVHLGVTITPIHPARSPPADATVQFHAHARTCARERRYREGTAGGRREKGKTARRGVCTPRE